MTKREPVSLVVLSHGLWGVKGHMDYIKNKLKDRYKDTILVLNIHVNEAKYSYDGIDICGERAAQQIEDTLDRLDSMDREVTKISFIGYSLGGLILRYVIGVLGERGIFKKMEPDYFVTFATPHMGVKLPDNSFRSTVFNYFSGRFVSRSGEQLQLRDSFEGIPLVHVLSDPDEIYFKHLAKFKVRRSYANVINDRTVPYWTAGLELMDYFHNNNDLDIVLDDIYTSIVTEINIRSKKTIEKKRGMTYTLKLYGFYLLLLILGPIFALLAVTVISIQGLISKNRVSRYLKDKTLFVKQSSERSQFMKGELLAGALDAINIPGENTSSLSETTSHEMNNRKHYYQLKPSPSLKEKSKEIEFDQTTIKICRNLNLLEWEVAWVYLNAFNAHGTIVCRQNIHTTEAGEDTVQHFLDTTNFV
ncbi:unnamed protein product [Rhizopus stolonifer]